MENVFFSCAPSFHYKLYHIQLFNQCAQKPNTISKTSKVNIVPSTTNQYLKTSHTGHIYYMYIAIFNRNPVYFRVDISHEMFIYRIFLTFYSYAELFLLNLVIPFSYVNTKFLDGVVLLYCQYFFLITKYSQYKFCSLRWLRFGIRGTITTGNHHDDW